MKQKQIEFKEIEKEDTNKKRKTKLDAGLKMRNKLLMAMNEKIN